MILGVIVTEKSPATQLTDCHVVSELLGILAAGAIPNHLHIAGVLRIPRSIVLPGLLCL